MSTRDRHHGTGAPERGIPDGFLVALIAFLLGLTLLVWTATGLAAWFAHGEWPGTISFARTPLAVRHLVASPHDVAGAWPDTAPERLSGYGLFWGIFISQLLVLLVLTLFAMSTVASWRARRADRRAGGGPAGDGAPKGRLGRKGTRDGTGTGQGQDRGRGRGRGHAQVQGGPAHSGHPAAGADAPASQGGQGGQGGQGPLQPVPASGSPAGTPTGSTGAPTGGPTPGTLPGTGWEQHSTTTAPHAASGATSPQAFSPPAGPASAAATPPAAPGQNRHTGAPRASVGTALSGAVPHPADTRGTGRAGGPAGGIPADGAADAAGTPWAGVPGPRTTYGVRYGTEHRAATAAQALHDAEGAALVVTSDPSLWAETKDARGKLGPVLLYDPGHLCDTPARLHWSPLHRCETREAAAARAVALLAPVRPQARMDAAMADTAETLLRCWLHAAAVDGRPFRQVHRWAQGGGTVHEAVRVLRTHPKAAAGSAGELESALTAHPERREVAQQLVSRALNSLSSVHIREACNPNRTDSLALESFVAEAGTLYLVGEAIEDPRTNPGAMPLLTALASSVVEHGRRMAARSSDGRLDPPLTLVLHDVAAVAPLPQLPELLSSGQAQGLQTLALLRSEEQARARWPQRPLAAPSP